MHVMRLQRVDKAESPKKNQQEESLGRAKRNTGFTDFQVHLVEKFFAP